MKRLKTILKRLVISLSLLFFGSACKSPTPPIIGCDPGFHICEDDTISCCLDTTSHNFFWTIDTLGFQSIGMGAGGDLLDIHLLAEDDIWVVGVIKIGPDYYDIANTAHWDGYEWEYFTVPFDSAGHFLYPYYSTYTFSDTDTWISRAGPQHYDGLDWVVFSNWVFNGTVFSIWGPNSNEVYFAGGTGYAEGHGSVTHYDGNSFTQMETGTNTVLRDIHGNSDHLFASGYEGQESILIEYKDSYWRTLWNSESDTNLLGNHDFIQMNSVEVYGDTLYASSSGGLIKFNYLTEEYIFLSDNEINASIFGFTDIGVNNPNDVMMFGGTGVILHFNGISWVRDQSFHDTYFNPPDLISIKAGRLVGDFAVMAGNINGMAVVIRGVR